MQDGNVNGVNGHLGPDASNPNGLGPSPAGGTLRMRRKQSYGGLSGGDSSESNTVSRKLSSIDMYRRVPAELMQTTQRGSIFSMMALCAVTFLAIIETVAFMKTSYKQVLKLDSSGSERIRLNFNITMMDLKCEYVAIDVVTALGNRQNVTKNIGKWEVSGEGVRQRFLGRNKDQKDLEHDHYEDEGKIQNLYGSIEELHENGEDAVDLDPELFTSLLESEEYLFVDFFAPWCSWCRLLEPTWEALAEEMKILTKSENNDDDNFELTDDADPVAGTKSLSGKAVTIGKMDCEKHSDFCDAQQVMAFPAIRLFVKGKKYMRDYDGDRTVDAFLDYLAAVELELISGHVVVAEERNKVIGGDKTKNFFKTKHQNGRKKKDWHYEDHPGCQVMGFLMTDRVPGNFHIEARSAHHQINPKAANLTHEIHHLSFGNPLDRMGWKVSGMDSKILTSPMDGNVYIDTKKHQAHHHFMKVISTTYEEEVQVFQVLSQSQTMLYNKTAIPEARFSYDMSPITVAVSDNSRPWYDYLTSLFALIGGTFTVIGFFDSTITSLKKK